MKNTYCAGFPNFHQPDVTKEASKTDIPVMLPPCKLTSVRFLFSVVKAESHFAILIGGCGVMSIPAVVVSKKVDFIGVVLKYSDVEKLLHKLGFLGDVVRAIL